MPFLERYLPSRIREHTVSEWSHFACLLAQFFPKKTFKKALHVITILFVCNRILLGFHSHTGGETAAVGVGGCKDTLVVECVVVDEDDVTRMEQRASSLQQRLEARRNMFFQKEQQERQAAAAGNPPSAAAAASLSTAPSSYLTSRSGKRQHPIILFSSIVSWHGCGPTLHCVSKENF